MDGWIVFSFDVWIDGWMDGGRREEMLLPVQVASPHEWNGTVNGSGDG